MKPLTRLIFLVSAVMIGCSSPSGQRYNFSLNGDWQLAVTASSSKNPSDSDYTNVAPVPGLVDLARPAMEPVELKDRIYWYKRNFITHQGSFSICKLKVNKAKYHTRIFINGVYAGENTYCFTPTELNITGYLNPAGEENEIIIAVGCRNNLPDTVVDGHDFEKDYYYPGIYDEVSLIYSGMPYVTRVQCAPMVEEEKLRIQAEFFKVPVEGDFSVDYRVRELSSGKEVSSGRITASSLVTEFEIMLPGCKLWSPETPFLYTLELKTSGDLYTKRFGMRSFGFDPESKTALLNGQPYYLRGTNICIYRFFDDPARKNLPWQDQWPIRLHEKFKSMNWNSIRYCIGFPPERWYEIADSLGFLIADEFPIWFGNNPQIIDSLDRELTPELLAGEYKAWMQERWNHPCVVIWDAQNESVTDLTGDALQMVRNLDLSGRPWENGWAAPRSETDPVESHPYLYTHYFQHKNDPPEDQMLEYFFDTIRIPDNSANERDRPEDVDPYRNPVLINEYCWLWMNRDGSPTRLTEPIYRNAFGTGLSTEEMYEIYARHLAIMTEYWRAHRKAAGVQHFCGLGYSRPEEPRGETSDNFIDIDNLEFEPHFEKYVKPAFSPVGLMLDVWGHDFPAGTEQELKLYLINDPDLPWSGNVAVYFEMNGKQSENKVLKVEAGAFESNLLEFTVTTPLDPGIYDLIAELEYLDQTVRSVRKLEIR